MSALKFLGIVLAAGLALCLKPSVSEAGYGRQYYGGWSSHRSYYYRPYYYKPYDSYSGYKHNYVVYYPSSPSYYYYYSPYTKQYWGRCPVDTKGKALYSFLEPDARPKPGEITADAPKADFPEATKPPPIPQTTAEKKLDPNPPELDLPPDDLPPVGNAGIKKTGGDTKEGTNKEPAKKE